MSTSTSRKKMGELLISSGAVLPEQVQAALGHQRRWGGRLGKILIGMGFVREEEIARALAVQVGVPQIHLATMPIAQHVIDKVPFELCRRHHLIPFALRRDERGATFLHVAMADPSDLEAIDDVRFHTGLRVEVAAATETDVSLAIRSHFPQNLEETGPFGEPSESHLSTGELLRFGEEPQQLEDGGGGSERRGSQREGQGAQRGLRHSDVDAHFQSSAPDVPPERAPARIPGEAGRNLAAASDHAGGDHAPSDPYADSSPAFQAVEALVRILTRKGILEEGEFLEEILRESRPERR